MSKKTSLATLMASIAAEAGSSDNEVAINATENRDDEGETCHTLNTADGANDVVRVDTEFVEKARGDAVESTENAATARLSLNAEPTFGVASRSERTEDIAYFSKKLDSGFIFAPLGKSQDVPGADEYYCRLCQSTEKCRIYVRDGIFVGVDPAVGTTPHTCVHLGKGRRGRMPAGPPSCDKLCAGIGNVPRVRAPKRRAYVVGKGFETRLMKTVIMMTPVASLDEVRIDKQEDNSGNDPAQRSSIAAEPAAQLPEAVERNDDIPLTGAENAATPSAEVQPAPPKKPKVTVKVYVPKQESVDYDSDVEILDVKPPKIPCAYSDLLRYPSSSGAGPSRGTYSTALTVQNPKLERQVSMGFGRAIPSTDDPSVVLYRSTIHGTLKFMEVIAIRDPVTGRPGRAYQCMGCREVVKKYDLGVNLPLIKVIDGAFVDINPDRPQENPHLCVQDWWQRS